jgi:hypothetical protein
MSNKPPALASLGARYRKAAHARDAAMAELQEAIREAVGRGMSKNEAIRASGLARQTVYDVFR